MRCGPSRSIFWGAGVRRSEPLILTAQGEFWELWWCLAVGSAQTASAARLPGPPRWPPCQSAPCQLRLQRLADRGKSGLSQGGNINGNIKTSIFIDATMTRATKVDAWVFAARVGCRLDGPKSNVRPPELSGRAWRGCLNRKVAAQTAQSRRIWRVFRAMNAPTPRAGGSSRRHSTRRSGTRPSGCELVVVPGPSPVSRDCWSPRFRSACGTSI